MNDITIFTYENTNVRTTTTEDGEPWFVAKDVCDILGLANMRSSLAALDEDEKWGPYYGHPWGKPGNDRHLRTRPLQSHPPFTQA